MEKDRTKWNSKYGVPDYIFPFTPSRFLEENLDLVLRLAPGNRALDIACGEGRNAIYLARHGFDVTAIDISEQGLAKGRTRCWREGIRVNFVCADLEQYRLSEKYDVILNFNFLLRDLVPEAIASLTPGGLLIMETIVDTPNLEGMHTKSFLLQPGELRRLFAWYPGKILRSDESPTGTPPVARMIFQKSAAPMN
ncbi:methyltransferase domain-containing protein [Geomonas sp. RF6]|uniref:class I SAM-dependent methyltransferase n=1 Tax=Geomonas sp. RF6 TaxID=2897342 RepID=UPI001E3EAA2A|nr:class I SAM-dependent methyltransferase [Geomonas sp. RF6]UFS68683.1 methyltransferase domain-containing protein [Geomonas sp. RF6]